MIRSFARDFEYDRVSRFGADAIRRILLNRGGETCLRHRVIATKTIGRTRRTSIIGVMLIIAGCRPRGYECS